MLLFIAAVVAYPIWATRQLGKIKTLERQLSQRTATTT
jgi:hypothetical protein